MNGRVYDARIARFIQADPQIDGVMHTQGYNRYSYGKNNPLNGTDPSGFGFFKEVFDDLLGITESPILNGIVQVAVCYFGGPYACATYATTSAKGHGASWGDALRAGAAAAFSYQAFSYIGGTDWGAATRAFAHGMVGGITAELQGGKFGHGFVSAGLTKALNVNNLIPGVGIERDMIRVLAAAVIGGTLSEATGGKFTNGAITAAFGQAFNGNKQIKRTADARMARAAYDVTNSDVGSYTTKDGYELRDVHEDPTGLKAALFVKGKSKVIAYAGTNGVSDLGDNAQQHFLLSSDQYAAARSYGSQFAGDVRYVGHSLGGGLASYSAIAHGRSATVFNAAGLNPMNAMSFYLSGANITHYYSVTDPLQLWNRSTWVSVQPSQVDRLVPVMW